MSAALAGAGMLAIAVLLATRSGRDRSATRSRPAPGAGTLRRLRDVFGRRRRAASSRAAVVGLLDALAAELRAGRSPEAALIAAAEPYADLLPRALDAVRYGGPVPEALELDSRARGAQALRRLAACWRVAEHTGAGLAAALERLAGTERESERIRLELATRAAEPRATMRVLAALPVTGIALGTLVGADPWGWLTGTAAGRVVLLAGIGLDLLGLLWARRMTARVEALL